jgi:hypothetical protein
VGRIQGYIKNCHGNQFLKGEVTVPTEEMRVMTRKFFQDTKLFAITLGLSEVWFRKDTGN